MLYNELSQNFIEYAVAVNTDRSIPDTKSGLKPVARRILWSALESGFNANKKHVKSAKIVGNVIGTYHPHGDSSVYGALVRLSQPWVMRYPLIDWHGNNGNISGDEAAHMRYTEARLSPIAEDGLLQNIKKHNVDFIPNYDDTTEEPLTLPAIFPNLLCNPNEGIGVALAAKWAPHNLKEVAAAIVDYINGKEPTLPGPDFPSRGVVINKDDIPNIMKTGHGTVKIRGKYKIEDNQIIFYEIPYGETIEEIVASIGEAAEKEIEEIEDVHDESNKKGIRIVITVKKDIAPEAILSKLFSKTNLQNTFSYNQVGLVGKTPTELNLKDCIKIYLDHNKDCLVKECLFDIDKAEKRLEIVEGLLKALLSIDEIIALIKKSESSIEAKEKLISQYKFTENQAKAILAIRLSSLAKLEGIELNNEKTELEENLKNWHSIVNSEAKQLEIIQNRLAKLVEKYGDDRRTELVQLAAPACEKEIVDVVPEDVVVVVTQTGMVKRIPKVGFKPQKRNTRGTKTTDAAIMTTIATNTIDTLMIFSNLGKMYKLVVDKVPVGTNTSSGKSLHTLIKTETNEKIIAVTSLHRKTNAEYIVFFTKNGYIKKTKLEEYTEIRRNVGTQAIKFKSDTDSLANVTFLKDEEVIIVTKKGMSIRFNTDTIAPTGRVTMGVKGITLLEDDTVLVGLPIKHSEDNLMVIMEDGHGKQTPLSEFTVQARGGKGAACYKDGKIAAAALTDEKDSIVILGQNNAICLPSSDVPILGRSALGNLLIKTSKVLSMVKIK